MRNNSYFIVLLLAFLVIASLYAILTPDWQAPDEPAHYNYIRQLASGELPVLEPGDYNQEYQTRVISSGFDDIFSIEPFKYQDYQPPLYYLLQTPIYLLFDGALRPLRLFSVMLGAGVVTLAYFISLKLYPEQRWLALTVAAFAAFLPQHVSIIGSVNNDSLAELIIAAILYLLITLIVNGSEDNRKAGQGKLLFLGILLGLGFLTKASVYIMVPVIGAALAWLFWRNWRNLWRSLVVIFVPSLLFGLVWWLRNVSVYDGIDLMGTAMHNRIVIGQPRTAEWIAERGAIDTLRAFVQTTFQSFWGQFGWMGVVMPSWVYAPLLLFTAIVFGGLGWSAASELKKGGAERNRGAPRLNKQQICLLLLAMTFGFSLLVYLFYNLTFVQHQGRYLFPALIPISLGVALGLSALAKPLARRWPQIYLFIPLGLALGLIALDLLALFRFILPSLT